MIFITGGSGLVGSLLLKQLKNFHRNVIAPNRTELNFNDTNQVKQFLENTSIKTVVHLAAETNVDLCEISRSHAIKINYEVTRIITDFCCKKNIRMIFISTSGALAGNNQYQHSELDYLKPSNFYSLTKARAEEYITRYCRNYLIIRASWMIGKTFGDNKKFAEKIANQIQNNVAEIKAVNNLYGSLTSGDRLAEFIIQNLEGSSNDIVHCASNTVCSRYDVARYIKTFYNTNTKIIPVSYAYFPLSAPRGFSEGLTSEIASEKFGYKSLSWEEELNKFLTL